jgi:hypothetical protein
VPFRACNYKTIPPQIDLHIIRQFVEKADWVTVNVISLLMYGDKNHEHVKAVNARMTDSWRRGGFKRLPCPSNVVYAHLHTRRKRIGTALFDHDNKMRECAAKFIHDKGYDLIHDLHFHPPSDAAIGSTFFEMDNGHMTEKALREKIHRNYMKDGKYQAVFFMASPYKSTRSTAEKLKTDEQRRLKKLYSLVAELTPKKPNRIIAASYEQFLEDGKVYNFKGAESTP